MQLDFHPYTRLGAHSILTILLGRGLVLATWWLLPPLGSWPTYLLVGADIIFLIWHIRLGAKAAKTINGFPLTWIIWSVILAVSGLTASNALDRITALYARPDGPTAEVSVLKVHEGAAIYSGDIDFEAFNALQETISRTPDMTTLILTSDGGRIAAARGMARLVRENGLATQVRGTCASACTLVFIEGSQRHLEPDARLGFHGYELVSGIVTLNTKDEEARDIESFVRQGVDRRFLDKAFGVPHTEMWFPPRSELIAAGVIPR